MGGSVSAALKSRVAVRRNAATGEKATVALGVRAAAAPISCDLR
jgi:hypothetical protein